MRGLNRTGTAESADERGIIAPLTAILMAALLGMTALAVDTAMMYAEKAQLQNAADASALAIAGSCSGGLHMHTCQHDLAHANALAGANALDGITEVTKAKVADGIVDVEVQSKNTAGKKYFSLAFARILGFDTVDIRATATAAWGSPRSDKGFPLALSQECWNLGPTTSPTMTLQKIMWKPGTTCTNDAGHTVPGGWGWLTNTADAPCEATTTIGDFASSNPGNNPPKTCKDVLKGWLDTLTAGGRVEVLFPVFDTASGQGNTGTFHIVGYATFSIYGWNFGDAKGPYKFRNAVTTPPMTSNLTCAGIEDRCIIGAFVKYQTSGVGGGLNFGTTSVSLTK